MALLGVTDGARKSCRHGMESYALMETKGVRHGRTAREDALLDAEDATVRKSLL